MPRFKLPHAGPKLIPVDFERQVLPGTFEHALCYLIDHEVDLSGLGNGKGDRLLLWGRLRVRGGEK